MVMHCETFKMEWDEMLEMAIVYQKNRGFFLFFFFFLSRLDSNF